MRGGTYRQFHPTVLVSFVSLEPTAPSGGYASQRAEENSPGSSLGSTPVGCAGSELFGGLEAVPKGGLQQDSNRNHCVCSVVLPAT